VFSMVCELQRERGFTAILVTHDVQEALVVSSRILWLDAGRVRFNGEAASFEASQEPELREFRDNIEALRATLEKSRSSHSPTL